MCYFPEVIGTSALNQYGLGILKFLRAGTADLKVGGRLRCPIGKTSSIRVISTAHQ